MNCRTHDLMIGSQTRWPLGQWGDLYIFVLCVYVCVFFIGLQIAREPYQSTGLLQLTDGNKKVATNSHEARWIISQIQPKQINFQG